ncbi:unnamed protein product [Urochloa decumbens]|uniref:Uncharacterized protein n=1 Tax=Urochloa decumbens TaxID=240449 RepID=A0ABC8ZWM9_9POAL
MDVLSRIASAISNAVLNPEKLPGALILCGILEAAAALSLIFFRVPGGVFLHHGDTLVYVYYGVLVAVVVLGLAEASVGFWIPGDLNGRHAVGMVVLWFSILPLIIIAALGGFSSASPK